MYQLRKVPPNTMTPQISRILVVDDEQPIREYLQEALRPLCQQVCLAADLWQAMRCMESHPHDVMLSDICLPGSSGMNLLELSQHFRWDCAVILMTGHASLDQVVNGVRLQAADFLLKPFSMDTLVAAVNRAHSKVQLLRQSKKERESLASGLRQRTEELEVTRQTLRDSYRSALETLVATLEAREHETYAHSFRVRAYALHLAGITNYPAAGLQRLAYAALLHDIGKIAVPDPVLLKPGPLNAAEFELLKLHSVVGERIVSRMGFLSGAAKIIRNHHERWDGKGYPDGLSGAQIPFGSRLFAVADTIDAMTSKRCYRGALTIDDARAELLRCSGTQFDPDVAIHAVRVADETWKQLRHSADSDAQSAIIPEVNPAGAPFSDPRLDALRLATAEP
jgi:putative nucleotidyltransferase with HDIG domain